MDESIDIALVRKNRPSTERGPGSNHRAAMRVRIVDDQGVLQFTLIHAVGCVLHRRASRAIHRLQLFSLRFPSGGRREPRPRVQEERLGTKKTEVYSGRSRSETLQCERGTGLGNNPASLTRTRTTNPFSRERETEPSTLSNPERNRPGVQGVSTLLPLSGDRLDRLDLGRTEDGRK